MEKNNSSTSNSSMCRKIRQALATSPVIRVIQRVSSRHEEPKPVNIDSNSQSSSPAPTNNTAIKTKTPLPQHLGVNTERAGGGAIPIKFDYSTPTSMGNGNSAVSSMHGHVEKGLVENSERAAKVAAKVEPEPHHVPKQGNKGVALKGEKKEKLKAETPGPSGGHHHHHRHNHHGVGERSEHQGRDINHTFGEYIRHAKHKIRTISNIGGGGQSHPPAAPDHKANNSTDKKENHQKDHFSDFIQLAKNKFRTSMKRG